MDWRSIKADFLLLLTACIWGGAFVAQRVGLEHVGPMTFNGVRFALGAVALIPLFRITDRQLAALPLLSRPTWKTYLRGGLMAGGILFAGATLQQVGLQWTTAGKGGFITGLFVVIVPILGLFFGQRPGAGTWVGALLAAWGLYLLSVTEALDISRGDLLVFGGAFFWAGHVMLIGWLSPRMNPVRLASAQFAVCSALSLVTGLAIESVTLADLRQAALPILYGGFMSVGVAYTLQVVAQRNAPAAHAAIILCLEGAFAALAGWLMLDEAMGMRGLVGCALMLGGMIASQPGLWGSRKTA